MQKKVYHIQVNKMKEYCYHKEVNHKNHEIDKIENSGKTTSWIDSLAEKIS